MVRKSELEPKCGSYGLTPSGFPLVIVTSRPVGYSPGGAPRKGAGGRQGGERGVLEKERGTGPPEPGPVYFIYPSLGPPKDRPHQGPSLKIYEGQAVRGGPRELLWHLDLDF